MKILITGIGNIGKSSLREMVGDKFKDKVIQIDMDYFTHEIIPQSSEKIVLVEDVHGLERNPEQYDKIIYLMPPANHIVLWLKRAWAWFSNGIVDLSSPKGVNKRYAVSNFPIILKVVFKNLFYRKLWVSDDIRIIKSKFADKTVIAENVDAAFQEIQKLFFTNRERDII